MMAPEKRLRRLGLGLRGIRGLVGWDDAVLHLAGMWKPSRGWVIDLPPRQVYDALIEYFTSDPEMERVKAKAVETSEHSTIKVEVSECWGEYLPLKCDIEYRYTHPPKKWG